MFTVLSKEELPSSHYSEMNLPWACQELNKKMGEGNIQITQINYPLLILSQPLLVSKDKKIPDYIVFLTLWF